MAPQLQAGGHEGVDTWGARLLSLRAMQTKVASGATFNTDYADWLAAQTTA
jgi:hypothetical protein